MVRRWAAGNQEEDERFEDPRSSDLDRSTCSATVQQDKHLPACQHTSAATNRLEVETQPSQPRSALAPSVFLVAFEPQEVKSVPPRRFPARLWYSKHPPRRLLDIARIPRRVGGPKAGDSC